MIKVMKFRMAVACLLAPLFGSQALCATTPAPGVFVDAGNYNQPNDLLTATLLPDGRVLLCDASTAWVVNFSTNVWTGPITQAGPSPWFGEHTATALPDGRVLVAGSDSTPGPSAEIFDPATNSFGVTGPMVTPRYGAMAVLLANGEVLVMGGQAASNGAKLNTAEIYSPSTGQFTATGSMSTVRYGATATLLNDGRVLVAAGLDASGNYTYNAETYSQESGTFTVLPASMEPVYNAGAILLRDGQVLIAGGVNTNLGGVTGPIQDSAIFDPVTNTFTESSAFSAPGHLSDGRELPSMAMLPNGDVLVAGGYDNDITYTRTADVYDPSTNTFTQLNSLMKIGRDQAGITPLADGRVVVAGGMMQFSPYYVSDVTVFTPDEIFANGFEVGN